MRGDAFGSGTKAKEDYAKAVAKLQAYVALIAQLQSHGRIAPETANLFTSQAHTLIQQLSAL